MMRNAVCALLVSCIAVAILTAHGEHGKFKLIHRDGERITVLFGGRQLKVAHFDAQTETIKLA